jgi:hypothetical protein
MTEPDLEGKDSGFTDHGWSRTWNAGSFFFTSRSMYLFQKIYLTMMERKTNEQDALTYLWENGFENYKLLNITYNMGIYHVFSNYQQATKPLVVAHFHPHKPRHLDLFRMFIPDRLVKIFNNYDIK